MLKIIEISCMDEVCHRPCFPAPSQPGSGLLGSCSYQGRSCCPAAQPHMALQEELGKSSRLRRTCLEPACRRPRRPVLSSVPQGRTGLGSGARLPHSPHGQQMVLGHVCEHPMAGVQMFTVSLYLITTTGRTFFSYIGLSQPLPLSRTCQKQQVGMTEVKHHY